MTHLLAALAARAHSDHLIIGPEGAVHQQTRCLVHTVPHSRVHRCEPRSIERRLAARHIGYHQRDVVVFPRGLAMGRVGRGLARDWERGELDSIYSWDAETAATQWHLAPVNPAVALKYTEQGIAV